MQLSRTHLETHTPVALSLLRTYSSYTQIKS